MKEKKIGDMLILAVSLIISAIASFIISKENAQGFTDIITITISLFTMGTILALFSIVNRNEILIRELAKINIEKILEEYEYLEKTKIDSKYAYSSLLFSFITFALYKNTMEIGIIKIDIGLISAIFSLVLMLLSISDALKNRKHIYLSSIFCKKINQF